MMSYCPQCQKPIYVMPHSLPYIYGAYCQCAVGFISITFTTTSNTTANPFTDKNKCPKCGWYVHLALHAEADCERLCNIGRALDPPKMAVPKAFYDAFSDEEVFP